jgi:hypothetical protein
MLLKELSWSDAPYLQPVQRPVPPVRQRAAIFLSALSAALGELAQRLLHVQAQPQQPPVLEFYAEAGAPEGALYVDGRLVGHIAGVSRL